MSIKKGTIPPRYDETFKSGAVKMVTAQGRPSREVAAELGTATVNPLLSNSPATKYSPAFPVLILYFICITSILSYHS